jgi:hypothetical protein
MSLSILEGFFSVAPAVVVAFARLPVSVSSNDSELRANDLQLAFACKDADSAGRRSERERGEEKDEEVQKLADGRKPAVAAAAAEAAPWTGC